MRGLDGSWWAVGREEEVCCGGRFRRGEKRRCGSERKEEGEVVEKKGDRSSD